MRIAEILSDLTSLRVCDPDAALALVSARPAVVSAHRANTAIPSPHEAILPDSVAGDADLTRARDLLELHASVKVAHSMGVDRALHQARNQVDEALRAL